ncbi:MAG: glycosyltransferase, partial [Candidatus Diapherotrites archaeon]|nr:glycosyltransferase [Candidatus Diapherotrites archaeon]
LFFSAADAVVVPYRYASQSGIIQIAVSFSKPVIAASVGGLGEAVEDGKTGFLAEPSNPKELALAIKKFFSSRQDFGKNIQIMKKDLSWSRYADAVLSAQ